MIPVRRDQHDLLEVRRIGSAAVQGQWSFRYAVCWLIVFPAVLINLLFLVAPTRCAWAQQSRDIVVATHAPPPVIEIINRAGCANCHIIPGVPGADGAVGPELTKIGKTAETRRRGVSASDYIRESILDPNAFIAPGQFEKGVMPTQFGKSLSAEDLRLLVDFLMSLDSTPRQRVNEPRPALELSRPPESISVHSDTSPIKPATDLQIVLGKYLFFDRRLSANNSLSCASCHHPDKAFTDGLPVSMGYPGTALFRNTPTLLNASHHTTAYWDGRMSGTDLPSVVRDHLTEPFFMAADGRLLIERVKQVPEFVDLFHQAYGVEPDFGTILKALAAYVASLNSRPAPYDRFVSGDKQAISDDAIIGKSLFDGKARCATCHSGPMFTDHQFHDLGLRTAGDMFDRPEQLATFRRFLRGLGTPNYRNVRDDPGRYILDFREADRGRFRTPSLREAVHTAPYMHDGQLATLASVIDFYNGGGGDSQRAGLQTLGLTKIEERQLLAFLHSLSNELVPVTVPAAANYAVRPLQPPLRATFDTRNLEIEALHPPRPITPLPDPPQPLDNPFTPQKVELGRLLFFDNRFSADGATSCNTCHPAHTGYTARNPISMGGTGTSHWRNANALYNVAYFEKFNWDGARSSIEDQNDGAWTGAVAGNVDADFVEERLVLVPEYRRRFHEVFGEDSPTWANALRAVAAWQRTLNSRDVPFDAFLRGDKGAISESASKGYAIFLGKARCIQCHDGPLLSDDRYHNLGVPTSPDFENNPLRQITFRFEQASNGVPRALYESAREDFGLYYVTKRTGDTGKFRTASLRELKHTAPYMHNGVLRSLTEVIDFYDHGGGDHPNKSPFLKALELTADEKAELLAFLESISGDPQIDRPPVMPPYVTSGFGAANDAR